MDKCLLIFLCVVICFVFVAVVAWLIFMANEKRDKENKIDDEEEVFIVCSPSAAERIKRDAPEISKQLLIATWAEDSDSVMIVSSREWDKLIKTGIFLEAKDNPN